VVAAAYYSLNSPLRSCVSITLPAQQPATWTCNVRARGDAHCRFDPEMQFVTGARRPILGSECKPNLPEARLKFVLMLIGRNLKNSFVFATLAFLTACQTPQASNQQDRPARTAQSSSPSSQYEVEPISGIQRPFGAPGTFQPGSGRGP
jgi:hypothetical protein